MECFLKRVIWYALVGIYGFLWLVVIFLPVIGWVFPWHEARNAIGSKVGSNNVSLLVGSVSVPETDIEGDYYRYRRREYILIPISLFTGATFVYSNENNSKYKVEEDRFGVLEWFVHVFAFLGAPLVIYWLRMRYVSKKHVEQSH